MRTRKKTLSRGAVLAPGDTRDCDTMPFTRLRAAQANRRKTKVHTVVRKQSSPLSQVARTGIHVSELTHSLRAISAFPEMCAFCKPSAILARSDISGVTRIIHLQKGFSGTRHHSVSTNVGSQESVDTIRGASFEL